MRQQRGLVPPKFFFFFSRLLSFDFYLFKNFILLTTNIIDKFQEKFGMLRESLLDFNG
jgi:hypothetical protein